VDIDHSDNNSMRYNCRIVEEVINRKQSQTLVNAEADLSPLTGYSEVPLLPLFKACAPLVGIIHKILSYVQQAIHETPEEPPNGLTIDESAAIRLYTMEWEKPHRSLYSLLNHTLNTGDRENLRPYFRYLKLLLTAIVKLPCLPQQTIWRGVTKDLSANFPCDMQVTWWAFSSCTSTMTVLKKNMYLGKTGPRTLFSIEAINGRTIRAHSHFPTEDEILLPPGTHMIVQSQLDPGADLHIIHLKQVVPKQPLLELPFKGNIQLFSIVYSQFQYISCFLHRCKSLSKDSVSFILSLLYFYFLLH